MNAHIARTNTTLAPTYYPTYCSKAGPDLAKLRSIPALTAEARSLGIRLIQVNTLIRHGARTPADKYNCWKNYNPQWNCSVQEIVRGHLTNETRTAQSVDAGFSDGLYMHESGAADSWLSRLFGERSASEEEALMARLSLPFEKRYDADSANNILGGTCQKGQLIAEGVQQHQIIGHQFAKAYQVVNEQTRVPYSTAPALVDLAQISEQVYFRSTDMQRTILSGSTFMTSFLQTALRGKGLNEVPMIPVHTMDLAHETLFPNVGACPALIGIRDEIFASSEYLELRTKWRGVETRVRAAAGRDDISDVWPGEIFDCVLTCVCPGRLDLLPEGLRPPAGNATDSGKTLIDELLEAVDDYAQFEYKYKDASFSKTAMAYAVVDIKKEIARVILAHLEANSGKTPLADVIGSQDQADVFESAILADKQPAKKLLAYAGHDTTIMPFLASLGGHVFDDKWPPYASQVVLEIYITDDTPPASFFRMIYNGRTITRDVPGCSEYEIAFGASDVCPVSVFGIKQCIVRPQISVFFHATQWATPANAKKLCQGSLVSQPAASSERWLLRGERQDKFMATRPTPPSNAVVS